MKTILFVIAVSMFCMAPAFAGEQIDLTAPVVKADITSYTVDVLTLDWGSKRIHINLLGSNGEVLNHTYEDAEAATLMKQLNKANLSVKSLHKRIMEQLVLDGVINGLVSGTPD